MRAQPPTGRGRPYQKVKNREMNEMKRIKRAATSVAMMTLILCCMPVYAAQDACIMETYTGDEKISVYVKGTSGEIVDANIQIGTATGKIISSEKIVEQEMPMRTLVMIDNSLSIRKEDRERIADFLQDLISDRSNEEEIAIAVFSEDMNWLTEYSDDYATLKRAVHDITYQDQETYLTDVLYELFESGIFSDGEDVYRRLVIVSDGVDNKSIGYTKEELYNLLRENPYPVYTIGCSNGKNAEELENMFALSRMTYAQAFMLDDVENTLEITESLKADRDIVKLEIMPDAEVMDGSRKVFKISYNDQDEAVNLSTEIRMPQKVQTVEPKSEPKPESEPETDLEPEPKSEPVPEPENDMGIIILYGCLVVAMLAAVAAVIVIVHKKRKEKDQFEPIEDSVLRELNLGVQPGEETEIVFDGGEDDGEHTFMIWGNKASRQIVLTDMNAMARSFQTPLEASVIIGRKEGNIILDYEKSVSTRHCEISVREGKFYIRDLQSSNGTYVNNSRILTETEIFPGNILKLGRLEMKFEVR